MLESHKTTLEDISSDGVDLVLGDLFVQACLRLHRILSIAANLSSANAGLLDSLRQKARVRDFGPLAFSEGDSSASSTAE